MDLKLKEHGISKKDSYECESCTETYSRVSQKEAEFFEKYGGRHLCPKCGSNVSRKDFWANRCDKEAFREKMKKASYFNEYNVAQRGKTVEERIGEEKGKRFREGARRRLKENNPQRGKPPRRGGGAGWGGWFDGAYFRSLKELSYLVNVLDGVEWENGEKAKYAVPYVFEGVERTYFPDYVVGNVMVEVKPKGAATFALVVAKAEAAREWAAARGMDYRLVLDDEFPILTLSQMKDLHDAGRLKFLPKFETKFEEALRKDLLHNAT